MTVQSPQAQQEPSPRRTRQRTKQLRELIFDSSDALPAPADHDVDTAKTARVEELPDRLPASLTRLPRKDHQLLLKKQAYLRTYKVKIPRDFRVHATAVQASLVFAQEEAGTAVCVSPDGLLLTCSHCVAETEDELDYEKIHWLLFADGRVVGAKCASWDMRRDLALLRIVSAQSPNQDTSLEGTPGGFPYATLADEPPSLDARLVCIGHPGSEDLEAAEPGVKTDYDVLHLSTGAFRGYADGQNLQDNSEIGALMHDCWTYWGHSGAPILDRRTGRLIGLHSSWDDQTAMRRGVPHEAIRAFIQPFDLGLNNG
jgi:hypothetical protein